MSSTTITHTQELYNNRYALIIREFNQDLIITHRTVDYMPDYRATAQLVQDTSYLLAVPNECADVPAMRFMPVIMCNEDRFTNPVFRADVVLDIDSEVDVKLEIANINVSQVYEWIPYTHGHEVHKEDEERDMQCVMLNRQLVIEKD